jgi:hypothetical protein
MSKTKTVDAPEQTGTQVNFGNVESLKIQMLNEILPWNYLGV